MADYLIENGGVVTVAFIVGLSMGAGAAYKYVVLPQRAQMAQCQGIIDRLVAKALERINGAS